MKMKKVRIIKRVGAFSLALALVIAFQGSYEPAYAESAPAPTPDYPYVSPEQQELTSATNKVIRVDIGSSTANYADTHTPYWNNWMLDAGGSSSFENTYQGVTFTLSDSQGAGVVPGFNKKLIQSSLNTPTKTLGGVTADSSAAGDAVTVQISGLSAGTHSITTWHSSWDTNPSTSRLSSKMSVAVNGTVETPSVSCPNSVDSDGKAGISYISFTATGEEPVTVTIQPLDETKNAELSAFEIDAPDPSKTISNTQPAEGDFHFDEAQGLRWQAGTDAVSHDVYLGTDFDSVNTATTSSDAFLGNQASTNYALSELDPAQVYWWRVDEHTSSGEVTKGEVRSFRIRHLAFPTAEGYGRFANGGRGGRVVEVTNLNDSGPGSLRQALEVDKGPRTVVFRVGGVIPLDSKITIPSDGGDVYIAGQTAPGDGITLTRFGLGLYTARDVIIRDIRDRVGDYAGVAEDGMGMGMANADHSIIDHCSISWGTDEVTSSRGAHNITFQKNIVAEALNDSVHYLDGSADHSTGTQPHSFAGSISGNIGSFYDNLLTNCTGRVWSLAGSIEQDKVTFAGYLDITNNVIYNFRDRMTDGGARRVDFVNNYYKMGPASLRALPLDPNDPLYNIYNADGTVNTAKSGVNNALWFNWIPTGHTLGFFQIDGQEIATTDMQEAYLSGNKEVDIHGNTVMGTGMEENRANVGAPKGSATKSDVLSDTPFFPSYVTTVSADDAYAKVLNNVGANKPQLDYLDQRYISEVQNGTYTYTGSVDGLPGIIDSQNDAGGYPAFPEVTGPADSDHDGMQDSWEIQHGLDPSNAGDGKAYTLSAEGYTNLEMYLDEAAGDPVVFANGK